MPDFNTAPEGDVEARAEAVIGAGEEKVRIRATEIVFNVIDDAETILADQGRRRREQEAEFVTESVFVAILEKADRRVGVINVAKRVAGERRKTRCPRVGRGEAVDRLEEILVSLLPPRGIAGEVRSRRRELGLRL